jgi:nicotinamidase/pyrazinamidase
MARMSRRSVLAAAGGLSVAQLVPGARAQGKIKPGPDAVLIVVDVQNCFTPGGSLAVKGGDEIVPLINKISFASSHPGKKPFETVKLPYGNQILWPDHCVQGTDGAAIHKGIDIPHAQLVIRKGHNPKVDSYSAFIEADGKLKTGLDGYLSGRGIKTVFVVGLATDFCVAWSAMDARKLGLAAYVIEDACRGIDLNGSLKAAWEKMGKAGVKRIQSGDIAV